MRGMAIVSRHRTALIALAIVALIVVGILAFAVAQPAPQPQPGRGAGQGFGGRMMGMRMMRGMGGGGVALAVADDAVFVVANNMLCKFDAETLELIAQAELPWPERRFARPEAAP